MINYKDQRKKNIEILQNENENESERVIEVKCPRLENLYKRLGLKQVDFADAIDCDPSLIRRINSGERALTIDIALKIAKKFNVSLDYLYGIVDYQNEEELKIEKAFEMVLNPEILSDVYYSPNGTELTINNLKISVQKNLIDYLLILKDLQKRRLLNNDKNKITDDDFENSKDELISKYSNLLNNKESKIYNDYILIPIENFTNDMIKVDSTFEGIDNYIKDQFPKS